MTKSFIKYTYNVLGKPNDIKSSTAIETIFAILFAFVSRRYDTHVRLKRPCFISPGNRCVSRFRKDKQTTNTVTEGK